MKKRGRRRLVLTVIIFFVLILAVFLINYFNLTGRATSEAFSFKEYYSAGIDNLKVRHVISWDAGAIKPEDGTNFLVFFGHYTDHPGNDFAYFSWSGGEENNFLDYEIKQGDVLSFWAYTKPGSPGCGIDIQFKKTATEKAFDLRTKNPVDQDGKKANAGNPKSNGLWYKRTIILPNDTVGRKINRINLAQIEDKDKGATFECSFDAIKITNPATDAIAKPEYNVYLNVQTTKDEYVVGEKICFSGDETCKAEEPQAVCGNNIKEGNEECDNGVVNNGKVCTAGRTSCTYCSSDCKNIVVPATCTDDCTPNSRRCCAQPLNSYIQSCGNYDGDSCFEWGSCGSCSSTDPIVRCVNVRGIDKCCRYNICF